MKPILLIPICCFQEQKKGTAKSTLVKVKNGYTEVDDYIATYEPLIFEEAKSQIIKEKEEEDVTDWKLRVVKSWSEADDFHFIEFPCEINEGESISQNDLLLLSRDKQFVDGKRLPTVYAFALVEHVRKYFDTRLVRVRLYLAGEFLKYKTDDIKSCPRLFNMRSHICETERQLYFMKVHSRVPFQTDKVDFNLYRISCMLARSFTLFVEFKNNLVWLDDVQQEPCVILGFKVHILQNYLGMVTTSVPRSTKINRKWVLY
ncbi:probable helicase MAGATAMA 3 [Vigna angularis]|uniref:probable helicase MAGATAMA 3 n=1 Tax=Phaseolus angularis TaxID=3914 RepID=UPI0022B3F3E5|nr:probable helicase MAGATAMA 3 [Vigna angularis]